MEYQTTWQRFVKGDHVSQAITPDDGAISLALVILVKDVGIVERLIEIQREIAQVVAFAPIPQDSLHITLTLMGELTGKVANQREPDRSQVSVLGQRLGEALSDTTCFQVTLKQVNSFFTCPFAEAHDNGAIRRMGERIEAGLNTLRVWKQDYGGMGYIPHMTLGYYREDGDGAEVRKVLNRLRGSEVGLLAVDRVNLVEAEWWGGRYRLKSVIEYELK
jgi:2'-5' RNA ligase